MRAPRPSRPAWVPAVALLPLRLFFGATFLYAGLDKLFDRAFLDPSSPASIYSQLESFARFSPLGGLIRLSEPWAGPIGILIAVAEIGVGIGALSGLAFRLAALGGAMLALLFWLSASWATHPYYFGPDLPYAAGWIVLALAGDGDLFVLRGRWHAAPSPNAVDPGARAPSITRRAVLETAALGVMSVVVASATLPIRLVGGLAGTGIGSPSPSPAGGSPPPANGLAIARINDLIEQASLPFTVPFDAPSPLPAGDPGVIVRLPDGRFVAYDAICPHQGCHVAWDPADAILVCPCHGASFDAGNGGRALGGPTTQALAALPISIDPATGIISLGG
jgi:thiosulfate dehydrogenase [quinone] large subunit